ncbi:MAG: hypothetical protein KJ600_05835 [Nanoarchaeota archaeon]|nr:hypothetical protein [Nanoarchaeota archaeon]MBU1104049.1 hypothetical protein [Nanoarchaeota archaeon]
MPASNTPNPQKKDLIVKLPVSSSKIKRQSLSTTHIIPSDSGLCDNLKDGWWKPEKYIFTKSQQAVRINFQLSFKDNNLSRGFKTKVIK